MSANNCPHGTPLEQQCNQCCSQEEMKRLELERLNRIPNGPQG